MLHLLQEFLIYHWTAWSAYLILCSNSHFWATRLKWVFRPWGTWLTVLSGFQLHIVGFEVFFLMQQESLLSTRGESLCVIHFIIRYSMKFRKSVFYFRSTSYVTCYLNLQIVVLWNHQIATIWRANQQAFYASLSTSTVLEVNRSGLWWVSARRSEILHLFCFGFRRALVTFWGLVWPGYLGEMVLVRYTSVNLWALTSNVAAFPTVETLFFPSGTQIWCGLYSHN